MLRRRICVWATIAAVIANDLPLRMAQADWPWEDRHGPETSVTQLANQIDELERHIDTYGTIVAKAPDVWGQARLTKYRGEYEVIFEAQKSEFKDTINAAISRSDQAFMLNALSLQAAVTRGSGGGPVAPPAPRPTEEFVSREETRYLRDEDELVRDNEGNPVVQETVTYGAPKASSASSSSSSDDVEVPEGPSFAEMTARPGFAETKVLRQEKLMGFGSGAIALEPTIKLDQMSRYLNHLHELRRISDGDDKSDAPGYALHLVRIPISVLPGEETRQGYGAEVTVIAKPNLHDDLLPTTFRSLVINDLVDQMSFPLAKFLDSKKAKEILDTVPRAKIVERNQIRIGQIKAIMECVQADLCAVHGGTPEQKKAAVMKAILALTPLVCELMELTLISREEGQKILKKFNESKAGTGSTAPPADIESYSGLTDSDARANKAYEILENAFNDTSAQFDTVNSAVSDLGKIMKETGIVVPAVAASPSRRSLQPFPPSHLLEVYGELEFLIVAKLAAAVKEDETNANAVLLLDMQKFLAEEFHAAYEFLNNNPALWEQCQQAIADAVRNDDEQCLKDLRLAFRCSVAPELYQAHTTVMAWMILVESALLNERLKEDIRDLASAKNAYSLDVTSLDWMEFCGPNPLPDARQLFNDYVNCRWPIHVVAVDPITQDQNVADSFSQRREMQLALALGYASGRIGAQSFTRMARRLELDMETIALNRTAVGFSHGDDTFGWRFYPRVQSPDTGGHLQTFAVDMFKGLSRDRILKQSRLEPGVREVTAIVIMPSFVPYVIFDTRTSWFRLTDPTERVMNATDSMDLSAEITSMRRLSAQCERDAQYYREGDVYRLMRAVEQLDRRLPLQTAYVQMPFENTLGGFEFFNTGVPDLAPELKGFYGEPGIKVDGKQETRSTIFIVGDHFSVHETKVIAGNVAIDGELMSRQVMRITVPGTALAVESGGRKVVDIHVATPYGISNHLLVPVVEEKKKEEPDEGIGTPALPLKYTLKTKEAKGCLCYIGECGDSTELRCLDDIEVEMEANCPCACPVRIEFAAFIQLKKADGTPVFKPPVATEAICLKLDEEVCKALLGGAKVKLSLNSRESQDLARAITNALGNTTVCKTDAATTIEVIGCLRVQNKCERCTTGTCPAAASDHEYDFVKLPKIVIKLTECAPPTSACPTCPRPASAAVPAGAAPVPAGPAQQPMPSPSQSPTSQLVPPPAPPAEAAQAQAPRFLRVPNR